MHLESQGLRLREGTIVDVSITLAPSSTKNRAREQDPEMHQTKKGNEWHFGMKIHIGVDADTGLVHSMTTTAANVHDITEAHHLLHGGEDDGVVRRRVSGYPDMAMRPGKCRQLEPESLEYLAEKLKASVRAKSLPSTAVGDGASLPEGEADVQLREGKLPGLGEEQGRVRHQGRRGHPECLHRQGRSGRRSTGRAPSCHNPAVSIEAGSLVGEPRLGNRAEASRR